MTDRRGFLATLVGAGGALAPVGGRRLRPGAPQVEATATVFYAPPDGENTLVRFSVSGTDAPAGRLRVYDRRQRLLGTAGVISVGSTLYGELWLRVEDGMAVLTHLEIPGRRGVVRSEHHLRERPRWTLYLVTRADARELSRDLSRVPLQLEGARAAALLRAGVESTERVRGPTLETRILRRRRWRRPVLRGRHAAGTIGPADRPASSGRGNLSSPHGLLSRQIIAGTMTTLQVLNKERTNRCDTPPTRNTFRDSWTPSISRISSINSVTSSCSRVFAGGPMYHPTSHYSGREFRPRVQPSKCEFDLTEKGVDFLGYRALRHILGSVEPLELWESRHSIPRDGRGGGGRLETLGIRRHAEPRRQRHTFERDPKSRRERAEIDLDYHDLMAYQADYRLSAATVLLQDCSHSMIL